MRKSIFEIIKDSSDMKTDMNRIINMATKEKLLCVDSFKFCTLLDFTRDYSFGSWKNRGHCTDINDFLTSLHYPKLLQEANRNFESMLTLVEIYYNFWMLSFKNINNISVSVVWNDNYFHLKHVMDDVLANCNHAAKENIKTGEYIIVEDKKEATAVSEIVSEELSFEVIRYNHYLLKGNVEEKKKILMALGKELEPVRRKLSSQNRKLEDNIFYMLNTLDIRHNNSNPDDKNYNEKLSKMDNSTLETWYDELYQMLLLGFLLIDNVSRMDKVDELKQL